MRDAMLEIYPKLDQMSNFSMLIPGFIKEGLARFFNEATGDTRSGTDSE